MSTVQKLNQKTLLLLRLYQYGSRYTVTPQKHIANRYTKAKKMVFFSSVSRVPEKKFKLIWALLKSMFEYMYIRIQIYTLQSILFTFLQTPNVKISSWNYSQRDWFNVLKPVSNQFQLASMTNLRLNPND